MAAQVREGGQEAKKQPLHRGRYRTQTGEWWAGVRDSSKEPDTTRSLEKETEAMAETRTPACETHLDLQLQRPLTFPARTFPPAL